MGCDVPCAPTRRGTIKFLLTHPVWDVTSRPWIFIPFSFISTHTSRVGCDTIPIYHIYQSNQFLLTHPVWDVTSRLPLLRQRLLISTHTSRVGCDLDNRELMFYNIISTHTSRVGCDHVNGFFKQRIVIFLLTHPVWDVTKFQNFLDRIAYNFYSHIPCGM